MLLLVPVVQLEAFFVHLHMVADTSLSISR